jgi:hypothetical protein
VEIVTLIVEVAIVVEIAIVGMSIMVETMTIEATRVTE